MEKTASRRLRKRKRALGVEASKGADNLQVVEKRTKPNYPPGNSALLFIGGVLQ